ncbi:MAG: AraC family transcriptional regulator [Planctomycetes bacterium]|nr:AraC family transcriptional regulator [Planctomycetota bacterium]
MEAAAEVHQVPLTLPPVIATRHHGFGSSLHTRHERPSCNRFWVVNLISDGEGELELRGQRFPFAHGCALVAPPDLDHFYRFRRPVRKTFMHFHAASGAASAPLPVVQDLGGRFEWFRSAILDGRRLVDAGQPARATALLWHLLWHLLWQLTSGPAGGAQPRHHPVVRALLDHLAEHLAEALDPGALARRLECSPTHLNRLCRAAFGLPLAAYVRRCRVERASHLLQHTTRTVADIAAEVGYADLQHFNKLMRAATGSAPRALRRG